MTTPNDSAAQRALPELIAFLGRIVDNTGPSVYFFDDGFPKQALFDDARKHRIAIAARESSGGGVATGAGGADESND